MISNPFLPINKASLAIIDKRANNEIKKNLTSYGLKIIETCECKELYDSISYHPDIVIHPITPKKVVVAPNVYDYYKDILSFYDIEAIKGEKKLARNYPDNIAYNVARISRYAIHNTKYTDEKLKYYLNKEDIDFINVKQGYSKCSSAIIGNNAIITSDMSIYKELTKYNIDVLLIQEGHIELPGLNHGFIGGATGMLSERDLLIAGEIAQHPSYLKIINFLKKHNVNPIILSNHTIIDIGSIITF